MKLNGSYSRARIRLVSGDDVMRWEHHVAFNGRFWCAPCKGGAFQRVKVPPGNPLQPEAPGATMEVTKWLKPLGKACHEIR